MISPELRAPYGGKGYLLVGVAEKSAHENQKEMK